MVMISETRTGSINSLCRAWECDVTGTYNEYEDQGQSTPHVINAIWEHWTIAVIQ